MQVEGLLSPFHNNHCKDEPKYINKYFEGGEGTASRKVKNFINKVYVEM